MIRAALIILLGLFQMTQAGDYFQQQVDYRISAKLVPFENKVMGSQEVAYHNNSPANLDTLYFHLYLNAFKPNSNFDIELKRRGQRRISDSPSSAHGGIDIMAIKIGDRNIDDYIIDDTIMKLPLPRSISPGDSLVIYFEFSSLIPSRGYRLGRRGNHFDIGQWYPKAVVYDRYGWHANQFQSMSEQYSDFGNYDIRITAPEDYLIAYCGDLINEEEIYRVKLPVPPPDSIIFNLLSFMNTESGNLDDEDEWQFYDDLLYRFLIGRPFQNLIDYSDATGTKTWVIRAENMHDFAFSASTDFIIDRAYQNGIIIDTYYKRFNRDYWSPRAITGAKEAMSFFNGLVGPYDYKHYTLVSGTVYGGIEYPALSIVIMYGGRDKEDHGLESVIAHEIAHTWFYGMIGSNQADQSFIDEGFASLLTCLFIERKFGRYRNNFTYDSDLKTRLLPNGDYRNDLYLNYFNAVYEASEEIVDKPANSFESMRAWRVASYDKPAIALFHLQYILGDFKFRLFLRELYNKWRFKHPYLEDIESLASAIHGSDLRYFFRQWYKTTWYLDYSLEGVKSRLVSRHGINWYETEIEIANQGNCISPLDIVVNYENGESDTLFVPVDIWLDGRKFHVYKTHLPLKPDYTELNPYGSIPDINRLNNNWRWPKFRFQFDAPEMIYEESYIEHYPERYTLYHQPKLWYNEVDGVKFGYGLNGTYLGQRHDLGIKTHVGTLNGRIDYDIFYQDILSMAQPRYRYKFSAFERDGRGGQSAGINYRSFDANDLSSLDISLSISREYLYSRDYLSAASDWQYGDINTFSLRIDGQRDYHWLSTDYSGNLITSAPGTEFEFARATVSVNGQSAITRQSVLSATIFTGYSDGNVPSQYLFHLAEASPYIYYLNHWYSARGTLPESWKDNYHLFIDDGASLPGFLDQDRSGLKKFALRLKLSLANPVDYFSLPENSITRELAKISNSLYITHGAVWNESGFADTGDFETEAGLHLSYMIPYWNRIFGDEKLHLYLPLMISNPEGDDSNFKLRWILSIAQ